MNKRLKVLSLFSGIGSFESALERLKIDYELVGFSEIDKYAITAYSAIHNVDKKFNLGDIGEVDDLCDYKEKVDLVVGGSPCQDFSIAGKQQGSVFQCLDCDTEFNPLTTHHTKRNNCPNCNSINLEKTRSSLLIEYLRTIREVRPKYFIYENVKNIVGKKFKKAFDMFNDELQEYGYNTYYQVLNAKDYGIPQNRERIFVIGIREDIDKGEFEFPKPFDSGLRLKDLLQDEVEEKYYINNDRVDELLSRLKDGKLGHYPNVGSEPLSSSALSSREHRASGWSESIGTLCARDYKDPKVIAEPQIVAERGRYNEDGKIEQQLEVQESGNSNALTTVQKDNLVLEPNKIIQINDPNHFSQRVYSKNGVAPTISAGNNGGGKEPCKIIEEIEYVAILTKCRCDGVFIANDLSEVCPHCNTIQSAEVTYLTQEELDNLTVESNKIVCEQRTDEGLRFFKDDVVGTIRTIDAGGDKRVIEKTNELQLFTNLSGGKWDKIHESARRVYKESGISPTIPTCGGGNIEPKVAVREATKKGYAIATVGDSINIAFPNSTTRRGRVGEGVAQTLETGCNQATLESDYKIRKLTPLECWRLMGFDDEDYWKARKALEETYYNGRDRSNSQMYKMAGNSIVVDVLVEIYKNLFKEYIVK